ncbi:hypothetical protein JXR93_02490 [bacterium]|nr:hypothetical protein [bacterium]
MKRSIFYLLLLSFFIFSISCNNSTESNVTPEFKCENGYQDNDNNQICEKNCELANLNCNNGYCNDSSGLAQCICNDKFQGEFCNQCIDGYQDNDNNQICEKNCELSNLNCNNGYCNDSSGLAQCICDEGYRGENCEIFSGTEIVINPTDMWGRDISIDDFTISIEYTPNQKKEIDNNQKYNSNTINRSQNSLFLIKSGVYTINFEHNDYQKVKLSFNYKVENSSVSISDLKLLTQNGDIDNHNGFILFTIPESENIWRHIVAIGFEHKCFSSTGEPFRNGNRIELFQNSELLWKTYKKEINSATNSINIATWSWDSEFELIREDNHPYLTESERYNNRHLVNLKNSNADVKIVVAQFFGQDHWMTNPLSADSELKNAAIDINDNIEFMKQANPTNTNYIHTFNSPNYKNRVLSLEFWSEYSNYIVSENIVKPFLESESVDLHIPFLIETDIASYHQKFAVIDNKTAFIGGMNFSQEYWDTEEHNVFEAKRMKYDSTNDLRDSVVSKKEKPDFRPFKDYMLKVDGSLVNDISNLFVKRWNYLIDINAEYSEYTNYLNEVEIDQSQITTRGVQAQLTLTMPEPFKENTILESHLKAISQADYFIFIEDQYFRAPLLNNAILKRMRENQNLVVIVITQPINEWSDGGCYWSYISYQEFMSDSNIANRFGFFQLKSFDYAPCTSFYCWGDDQRGYFENFYLHSKMFIVDDIFMSVGSCNKNNRGFIYEAEANISIYDSEWVENERKNIFKHILKSEYQDFNKSNSREFLSYLKNVANINDIKNSYWDEEGAISYSEIDFSMIPTNFLYSLKFRDPSYCAIEWVGKDTAK